MPLNYSIVLLGNPRKPDDPKKAYARSQVSKELTLKGLSQRVAAQTTVSRADVSAVLISVVENMIEALRNGQICESSLPYSVRLAADKNITVFNQKLRRRAQIRSEITPRPNGTYTVSLAFCDEQDSPLLKMELMVPKEVMAKDLADRFRKNTEQLYASVINALFEAPREKKE